MAKEKNTISWLRLGISLAIVLTVAVGAVVWAQADMKALDKKTDGTLFDLVELKDEGCKPTVKLTLDMALVQKDISALQEDVSDMRTEQTAGFKEILSRLPEKPK